MCHSYIKAYIAINEYIWYSIGIMAMPALTIAALNSSRPPEYDPVSDALKNLDYRPLNESRPKLVDSYAGTGPEADETLARQLSIHQQHLASAALNICIETNKLHKSPMTASMAIRGIASVLNRDQMWRLELIDGEFQEEVRSGMSRIRRGWRAAFGGFSDGGPLDQLAAKAGNPYWNTPDGYVYHLSNATTEVQRKVGLHPPRVPRSVLGAAVASLSGNTLTDWLHNGAESATAAVLPAQVANERAAYAAAFESLRKK
jgi:hypothetical protein